MQASKEKEPYQMMPYLTKKPSLGTPAALLLDQGMAACVTT